MAVRPYSELDNDSYAHEAGRTGRAGGSTGAQIFLWIAMAIAAAFWGLTSTTAFGILGSIGPAGAPGPGEIDAGGVGWVLINFVGGVLILGGALAYGVYRWASRDRRKDALTEAATHAEYDMVEAAGGDDVIGRSPSVHEPMERDAARAARGEPLDPSTGGVRHQ